MCGGLDHHSGDYTPRQRADLDRVLAFNRAMSDAINDGIDIAETERFLDPDPLRYMWVDEGQGRLAQVIDEATLVLERAPKLTGHLRRGVRVTEGSHHAARPSIAVGPDDARLLAWIEWLPGQGDVVRAVYRQRGDADPAPEIVSAGVVDVFRPTAMITAAGVAWILYGASVDGEVGVWATRRTDDGWTVPELVSTSAAPSFNQEAAVHADGSLEVCWQGRDKDRFGIFSRTFAHGSWGPTVMVSAGVEANVWDPAIAAFAGGATAYAWSEYRDGAYRIVVRRRDEVGVLEAPRDLSSGSDYALHPSLAVTDDQQLWCAFDLITVVGHGGSGPTKLRPSSEVGADPAVLEGFRPGGESVPPELLPDVSASIRVVAVTDAGVAEPAGILAPGLDVVPSGLPKLAATPDGGLAVAYRIHRKLPLMTYYWEVATQVLGVDGWLPPSTYSGTDGTLEEPSIAAGEGGVVVAAQSDARLQKALDWTEGFGGRECPYLLEHQGSVVWHGVHGIGAVVTSDAVTSGPVPDLHHQAQRTRCPPRSSPPNAPRPGAGTTERSPSATTRASAIGTTRSTGVICIAHSLVSRCTAGDEPSLEDFYRYAWDVCEYDFWAVTDHSENSTDYQWWSIQKIADLFQDRRSLRSPLRVRVDVGRHGHQNVIFGDVARGAPIFSAFAEGSTDPAGLWHGLDQHPDFPAITIPHHPGSAMVHNDWDYHDPEYSRLVEIFQACRGNYEADGAFRQYSDGTMQGTFARTDWIAATNSGSSRPRTTAMGRATSARSPARWTDRRSSMRCTVEGRSRPRLET